MEEVIGSIPEVKFKPRHSDGIQDDSSGRYLKRGVHHWPKPSLANILKSTI